MLNNSLNIKRSYTAIMACGLFVFSLLIANGLYAQSPQKQSFNIVWELANVDKQLKAEHLQAENVMSHQEPYEMLYYHLQIDLQPNQTLDSLKLVPTMWEGVPLDSAYAKQIQDWYAAAPEQKVDFYIKQTKNRQYAIVSIPVLESTALPFICNRLMSADLYYVIKQEEVVQAKSKDSYFSKTSVFATGDWYQMRIHKTGVYKLTTQQLQDMGINTANIAAKQIKIYGFGGMIDKCNNGLHYPDIPQVAVQLHDGGDNKMDAGDYILFYAEGADMWEYSTSTKVFNHINNNYSNDAYYYINVSEENAQTIEQQPNADTPTQEVNTFIDYALIEDDVTNLGNFGSIWLGDEFSFTTHREYEFNFSNLVPNANVYFNVMMAADCKVVSKCTVNIDGFSNSMFFDANSDSRYYVARFKSLAWKLKAANENGKIPISLEYNKPVSGSVAWLDYIEINVERYLSFKANQQQLFRNPTTVGSYQITKFNVIDNSSGKIQLWDVTEPTEPKKIDLQIAAANQKYFTISTDRLREFVAFDPSAAYVPKFVKQVPNQNLHAAYNHNYLIIAHKDFINQANELADYHRENSGLTVYVVDVEDIYNEYSSGRLDPVGIRDFIRSQYYNSDETTPLKYVLLFGDASYDYRNISAANGDFVPTFIFEEKYISGLNISTSLVSDDFYGFMDDDECVGRIYTEGIDIGIGRFVVNTVTQAEAMIAKVKQYDGSPASMGDWRNLITLSCDDEQGNQHFKKVEEHANTIASINPYINLDKIYLGSYPQITTSAGQRAPMVNEAINNRIEKGTLIFAYAGHGGETGLTDERIMDVPDIRNWKNWDKLFVMLTATCEFSRYDDYTRTSAGEYALLNDQGGAIALYTTSRPTSTPSSAALSRQFFHSALRKTDGKYPTFGDINHQIKANSCQAAKQMFVLLGDPALRIKLPEYYVHTDSVINNSTGTTDSLQAYASITVTGKVCDMHGNILNDFNGNVYPTVFDKPGLKSVLETSYNTPPANYYLQNNVIYKGNIAVDNGEFKFSFVVPKDIVFTEGHGKISYYADNGIIDATGADTNIVVGGYAPNYVQDTEGPLMRLFINDTSFVEGGVTNENPMLLVRLSDENGINTTGNNVGHELLAVLDEEQNKARILNDYYVPDLNTYKSGYIKYPFYKLSEGAHTLSVRVWDVYNNSSEASIAFQVVNSSTITIEELFNYPNPVGDNTTFSFQHNQSEEDLEVSLEVYDMQGRLVNVLSEKIPAGGYRSNSISWDVCDAQGNALSKGMYLYRLQLKTTTGKIAQKTAKLIVIK